ncbi:hypothetical protein KFL_000040500 [Klebsormidium nitens]|uniref:FAD-binding PCMH-type domain-containing protein n=1 Tax=Klebsormidium nitens TaxID=105231 RepID=A0A1Y1HHC1_KLENI|nr:hypothetical protein KFL_000040500 [Klebsormidium nitens]|eukprot:GAQ77850.1 hypothetical protein KFL_000040500 [Klebsormidium nitens]
MAAVETQSPVDALQKSLGNALLTSASPAEDLAAATAVFNGFIPKRKPEEIVVATGVADVMAAVKYANAKGLKVSVKANGHHWQGSGLREGSLLINLEKLKGVRIDVEKKTASVQPGVTAIDLHKEVSAVGLYFPGGHCPTVGISGYTLNGGYGWNSGHVGSASDHLISIDVVLADGSFVRATDDNEYADLLWAARGAGQGFFGVVTCFEYRLDLLPRGITLMQSVFPLDSAADVIKFWNEKRAELPSHMEVVTIMATGPTGHRCTVFLGVSFADTEEQGRKDLAVLEDCPVQPRLVHDVHPSDVYEIWGILDKAFPKNWNMNVDVAVVPFEATTDMAASLAEHFKTSPSPLDHVLFAGIGPKAGSVKSAFSPEGNFEPAVYVGCYGIIEKIDVGKEQEVVDWTVKGQDLVWPHAVRGYVGEGRQETAKLRRCYTPEAWDRLEELREKYDPARLFLSWLAADPTFVQ